jgi:hypothetical protein
MIIAIICVLLAIGLAIEAHAIDDRLLPAGADRSHDITLSYAELVAVGVVLLASTLATGVFTLERAVLRTLAAAIGSLFLICATGWYTAAAMGDLVGLYQRTCASGEIAYIFNLYSNTTMCVPSQSADRIQLPLHIGVVVSLLLALALSMTSGVSVPRPERSAHARARRDQPEEPDAQEQYLYEQHLFRQQRAAQRRKGAE